jgi:putative SOS response-associated peptidase YedK
VWLGEAEGDPQTLMHPLRADRFRVWPVSRAINSVRNDGPELLEPHAPADTAPALL